MTTQNFEDLTPMRFLLLIACLLSIAPAFNQTKADFPQDYFRSPIDFKIYLSGTFGEPRTTHYHTGLDIKTQGVEGKNLYAVAEGYVSRIKVSPFGYGNALYITHPNGYTSVYAHMSAFNEEIDAYAKSEQERLTAFEVDLDSLPEGLITVQKSTVIGLSGNSGGSGGPHLHFEIRDSLERPINPLLFGFDNWVSDTKRPEIFNVLFYNQSGNRQFSTDKMIKPTNLGSGNYQIASTLKVNTDELGLGIHTVDKFNEISNKNGVYEILVHMDGELVYHYRMSRISFDHTKHVYTQCDFWRKRNNNQTVYKCFKEQGNLLDSHPYLFNNGVLMLYDTEVHPVKIEVLDFHGNKSTTTLKVQKDENASFFLIKDEEFNDVFNYSSRNTYDRERIMIDIPKESLFDDLYFQFSEELQPGAISNGFHIHNPATPIAKYYNLKLKANNIDSAFVDKYLIVRKDYKGRIKSLDGTRLVNRYFMAESRDFGYHYITIDTIAPVITPINFYNNKNVAAQSTLKLKATDNLSGILEYNAILNGEWVILRYDAKRASFIYEIDDKMLPGSNTFEVIISDERSNAKVLSVTLLN